MLADFLNTNLGLGLINTSYVLSGLFLVALAVQLTRKLYTPRRDEDLAPPPPGRENASRRSGYVRSARARSLVSVQWSARAGASKTNKK
jgi:hypothetical protein